MKLAIIGHRGVGKSSLAKRLEQYYLNVNRKVLIQDLDAEIERRHNKTISQIFEEYSEAHFRNLERLCFQELSNESTGDLVIITGAGFEPKDKLDFQFLWLQRPTDSQGRIFVDRPRLDKLQTPLNEYFNRYQERERRYFAISDTSLIIGEGFDFANSAEEKYFTSQIRKLGGAFTVLTQHIPNLRNQLNWGIDFFELRDDLLSTQEILKCLELIPKENILLSFRNPKQILSSRKLVQENSLKFDWPAEFTHCDWGTPWIVSLHEDDLNSALQKIQKAERFYPTSQMKFAVQIDNFISLAKAHHWQQEAPRKRSFLPMSTSGAWTWYRLWTQHVQPLQFFRIDSGSAPDQPSLLERLRQNEFLESQNFAAVLGDPILHSRSPGEQFKFFKNQNQPFYAIQVIAREFEDALKTLQSLGLKEAAVTSPLKELAYKLSRNDSHVGFTNTLALDKDRHWIGTNTDIDGLHAMAHHISPNDSVVVWGGGGTLSVLKQVVSKASYYSSRSGKPREAIDVRPQILIWAVGRKNFDQEGVFPPSDWPLEKIIDLNYAEDSPGRECALKFGCAYISGLEMFQAQAQAQRKFWSL